MINLVGEIVTVKPAFNSETGVRDIWDEIAGCSARVIRIDHVSDTVDILLPNGDETNVHIQRLMFRRPQ